jgi:3-methylcrotonyl-CoA carboxylase alpha subunit
MVTGLDLVEWQLRVAAGEPLPLAQHQLALRGHAIEARLYAEDPAREFLPSTGTLRHLRAPAETADVRIDTGVREGDAITPYYDPMIAKLIVHGADRAAAVRRLGAALAQYQVAGVQTNLRLLRAVAGHAAYRAAELDTGFIARHAGTVLAVQPPPPPVAIAAAAVALLGTEAAGADPWAAADSWRLNLDGWQTLHLGGAATCTLRARRAATGTTLVWDDTPRAVAVQSDGDRLTLHMDGAACSLTVLRDGPHLTIITGGEAYGFEQLDPLAPPAGATAGAGRVLAPIPGRIAAVLVANGDAVARGQALVVLEAMKMELTLTAAAAGVVAKLGCAVGDMVAEGRELVEFTEIAAA